MPAQAPHRPGESPLPSRGYTQDPVTGGALPPRRHRLWPPIVFALLAAAVVGYWIAITHVFPGRAEPPDEIRQEVPEGPNVGDTHDARQPSERPDAP